MTTAMFQGMSGLEVLARRLSAAPLSIAALMARLGVGEGELQEFYALVDEYLPDETGRILNAGDILQQVYTFSELFQAEYFSFGDGFEDMFSEEPAEVLYHITRGIPIDYMGCGYDDYEYQAGEENGRLMMTALVECPHSDMDLVPLIDKVKTLRGAGVAKLLPAKGWSPGALLQMTRGTRYEALGMWASWLHQDTGIGQLDFTYEDGYEPPNWEPGIVETITKDQPCIERFYKSVNELSRWLEDDKGNFKKMVDFLRQAEKKLPPEDTWDKEKTLLEIFTHENKDEQNPGNEIPRL